MAIHACRHSHVSSQHGDGEDQPDGTVNALTGTADLGGNQKSTMAIIVAEELGIPADRIGDPTDTDTTLDTGSTGSKRTIGSGNAISLRRRCERKLKLVGLKTEKKT